MTTPLPATPASDRPVIFARSEQVVKDDLNTIRTMVGLPAGTVVDAIICAALGYEHPHAAPVKKAIAQWKRGRSV